MKSTLNYFVVCYCYIKISIYYALHDLNAKLLARNEVKYNCVFFSQYKDLNNDSMS